MTKLSLKTALLEVGDAGGMNVRIPFTTAGEGRPRLAITCGVHGDEFASLIICRDLLDALHGLRLKGSIHVVTAANPPALATRTRVAANDFLDLNRVGRGDARGTLTERTAAALFEFLSGCGFVIDLHEFLMDTPPMAIYSPARDPDVDQRIIEGISAFGPTVVWSMNHASEGEAKYASTLVAALASAGTPGFVVETSRPCALSADDARAVVRGLVGVARLAGVIEGEPTFRAAPAYARAVRYADGAGVWRPESSLMSEVKAGEKVGELTRHDLVGREEILSQADGTLIQMRSADVVDTGASLFTVGVADARLSSRLDSAARSSN